MIVLKLDIRHKCSGKNDYSDYFKTLKLLVWGKDRTSLKIL